MATRASPGDTVDLNFPLAGVDLSMSHAKQPARPLVNGDHARTTALAKNVRAFDPHLRRARGGSRTGFSRHIGAQLNGSNHIQCLDFITESGFTTGGGGSAPGGGSTLTAIYARDRFFQDATSDAETRLVNGNQTVWSVTTGGRYTNSSPTLCGLGSKLLVVTGTKWRIYEGGSEIHSGSLAFATTGANFAYPTISLCHDGTDFYLVGLNQGTTSPGLGTYACLKITTSGVVSFTNDNSGTLTGVVAATLNHHTSSVIISGTIYTFVFGIGVIETDTSDGSNLGTLVTASAITNTGVGNSNWQMQPSLTRQSHYLADGSPSVRVLGVTGQLAAAGTTLAIGVRRRDPPHTLGVVFVTTGGSFTPAAVVGLGDDTTNAVGESNFVALASDGTDFYALLGNARSDAGAINQQVKKITTATGAVAWTSDAFGARALSIAYSSNESVVAVSGNLSLRLNPTTGAISQSGYGAGFITMHDGGTFAGPEANPGSVDSDQNKSQYNRAILLVGVAGGTVKVSAGSTWASVNVDGGQLSSTVSVVRSAVNGDNLFFVDGTNYTRYEAISNTLREWTATSGDLPVDLNANPARLIATWRGRSVLAGLPADGKNWFMSKVNDPFNWNYSDSANPSIQAVAGNNSDAGKVPDTITALVPYSDDVLIFGGDRTIWKLNGDPMAGGRLNLISDTLGMAWGKAWCRDPAGTLYFMSNLGSIYTLPVKDEGTGQPVRLSQSIEQLLEAVNLDKVVVHMAWDEREQGLRVFITHFDGAQAERHFFWEQRSGAWWPDELASEDFNPLCSLAYHGNASDERVVLMGSWDGYVRAWTSSATHDDGLAFESEVLIGPLLTADLDEIKLQDLQAVLSADSGDVSWDVLAGQTCEAALARGSQVGGTWKAGRNYLSLVRRAGHALYLRVGSDVPWSMEGVRGTIQGLGKVRRRWKLPT